MSNYDTFTVNLLRRVELLLLELNLSLHVREESFVLTTSGDKPEVLARYHNLDELFAFLCGWQARDVKVPF